MPYSFGSKSERELVGVHPDVTKVSRLALTYSPVDFGIYDGNRTRDEQLAHVHAGTSQTMESKHRADIQPDGLGRAVDAVPWIAGKFRWEWPPLYQIAAAYRRAAIELGVRIRWGGVWDRVLNDLPDTPDGLEQAVEDYVERTKAAKRAAGKKPRAFIDGPHFELA